MRDSFGSSEMAQLVRDHDWSATKLGAIATWPERLKAEVEAVLASPLVSTVALRDDRLFVYNDAASRLYGDRHPGALGRPLSEVFADSYPQVEAIYDRVFAGESVEITGRPLAVGTDGGESEVFDACVTPVRDSSGAVIGAHMIGLEIGRQHRAEAALRDGEQRQAFLLTLSDALGPLADPVSVTSTASEMLGCYLGAGRCGYGEVDATGVYFTTERDWTDGVMPTAAGRHRVDDFGADVVRDYRAGKTLVIDDAFAIVSDAETRAAYEKAGGFRANVCIPLMKAGRWVASLYIQQAAPRHWLDWEIALIREVADRTWAAVERARAEAALRDREAELARTQRIGQIASVEVILADPPVGYRSPEYRRMHGLNPDCAIESHDEWLARVHPDDREREEGQFLAAMKNGGALESEYRIVRPSDGETRWISAKGVIERDSEGRPVRLLGAHVDITDRKETEQALAAIDARQRALIEGIPQLVWRAVDSGDWTWASPQWVAFTGQAEIDSHGLGWLEEVHPDDRTEVLAIWNEAISRGEFHADYRVHHRATGLYRWVQTRATPVRDDGGKIVEWLGTSTDVEDMRRLQETQRALVAELQHRVRNILAVIRSIVRRSFEGTRSLHDYAQHLEGRIAALARTQVLLTRHPNADVDLEELVRDELVAQAADEERITIVGPKVALSPKAAEILALAIHELGTNAVKYGAIADPVASLRIEWKVEERGGDDRGGEGGADFRWLTLCWTEQGGSVPADLPRRSGFGTELITRRVPYELNGTGELSIQPGRIVCTIAFPLIHRASILETRRAPDVNGD